MKDVTYADDLSLETMQNLRIMHKQGTICIKQSCNFNLKQELDVHKRLIKFLQYSTFYGETNLVLNAIPITMAWHAALLCIIYGCN